MATANAKNNISQRILKVTGMFGGLQGVGILSSVVRTKLIAMWIGPASMGLFAIYNTAIEALYSLSQMGIGQSGVREIAGCRQPGMLSRVVTVVRRWGLMLGAAAMLLTMAFSPGLSTLSFGSSSHWGDFIALALLVGMNGYNVGEIAVLQGLGRFRQLATSQMVGYVGGLIICIPLYYYLGMKSILPSIMIHQFLAFAVLVWYRAKIEPSRPPVTWGETFSRGGTLIRLGIFLTVSDFIAKATAYGFNVWLNHYADLDQVGFYQAGFSVVNRYVGLIFTAIAMEYYPRLSSVVHSRRSTNVYVSNQIVIAMLLLAPVVTIFIAASPLVIRILYTSEYLVIQPFIIWAAMGTVLRGVAWCMAFVIMAKADGRLFLITEGISGAIFVAVNILFFSRWGIAGMGVAYVAWYAAYLLIVMWVYFRLYGQRLSAGVAPLVLLTIALTIAAALCATFIAPIAALPFCLISCLLSYRLLRAKL